MDQHSHFSEIDQYRFLIKLDDALRTLVDSEEITRTAATILGQYLRVNRCAYAYVEDDRDSFTLTGDYNNGVPSIVGTYNLSSFGAEFVQLSREGLPYVVEDTQTDPRVADVQEAYRQTQIGSVISVPIIKAGKFVAGMAVHQTTSRAWQDYEIKLLSMVASRIWESIERNRIANELRDNETRYRTLVESISSIVWHTDANGAMNREESSWGNFTGQSFEEYKGSGWLDAIHPEDKSILEQVWVQIAQGNPPKEVIYRLRRNDGQYRQVISRATAIRAADGSVKEWVGNCTDITDSVEHNRRLHETRERLDHALAAAEVGTWVWNLANNLVYGDKNLARLFGVADSDTQAFPVEKYMVSIHPEDRDRVSHIIQHDIESGSDTFNAEYRIVQPGGQTIHVIGRGKIERDATGNAIRMSGATLDVTNRVKADQALRESEERLRHLANTIPHMAWIANADGWITWYNNRWYDYTGTTLEEVEGWGWQKVHDPDFLPKVKEQWEATLLRAEPFEMIVPLSGKDGQFRRFFTLISPLRNDQGEVVQWFGTNTDVTPLEEAQQALQESEEKLREGLVAARMAVWDWNLLTGEVEFTANSEEAFGHSWATEKEGWSNVHPDDRQGLREIIDKAVAECTDYDATVRMVRPVDQEIIWVDIRGKVKCDETGKPVAIRGVFLDVTDRKRAEEALREEHRRKDEFLAMLAHELRNPLSPISASAQLLPLIAKDENRLRNTMQIISRQINHITKIVDDLLDVSRVNRGLVKIEKEPLDLRSIIREALASC
jgi:PAS domain S-box-containing protein